MSMRSELPTRGTRREAPTRRTRGRRAEPSCPPDPARLYLAALRADVDVSDALNHPLISELLVEDLCWRSAHADWLARRPGRFRRWARATWRAEGRLLDEKRDRIRHIAVERAIVANPRPKRAEQRRWNLAL